VASDVLILDIHKREAVERLCGALITIPWKDINDIATTKCSSIRAKIDTSVACYGECRLPYMKMDDVVQVNVHPNE
jgi:hypothetical protein